MKDRTNPAVAFVVKFLNGEDGKPIRLRTTASIWLGNEPSPRIALTNSAGEIVLRVKQTQQPREIRILPDFPFTNRRLKEGPATSEMYALDDIVNKGIVTDNVCGETNVRPNPGVLVLYVREMTITERWQ